MTEQWQEARKILEQALALQESQRDAFIRDACGDNEALAGEVRSLMEAKAATGDPLEQPPAGIPGSSNPTVITPGERPDPGHPKTIGAYRIKRRIGSGGMGTVYLAQQESPRRDVAIKVMNPGVVSSTAMRRFEFEAQTLGRLQHPGIAQVYEAGTFDDGSGIRPYFAMEYISSAKELGDFMEAKQLDVRGRLELIRRVCEGIEYGHQRGVIHRDLKPGNILVGVDGQPKIIDFGVARSTDSDAVSVTLSTESGQLIGTLQYMSPEQVDLDPADLDTRSDVYSLGVLLHEVLTGEFPYELTGASLTKAAQLIKESKPRRLGEIDAKFKGDLETICLKALEKDRDRRYQSVGDLSEDIRRYLADEAIMARQPRRTEQLRRFVRKHRMATAATIVVSLALLALAGLSVILYMNASRNLHVAKRFNEFMTEGFGKLDHTGLGEQLRETILDEAQETLSRTLLPDERDRQLALLENTLSQVNFTNVTITYLSNGMILPMIEGINVVFADVPFWQGGMLMKMGLSLKNMGQNELAEGPIRRSIELLEEAGGPEHKDTLLARGLLAHLHYKNWQHAEAEEMFRSLVPKFRKTFGPEHIRTLEIVDTHGASLILLGRFDEGAAIIGEGLEIRRRLFGDDDLRTVHAMDNYTGALVYLDRDEEAEQYAREAWLIRRRNFGDDSLPAMKSQALLGGILVHVERFKEAEELMQPVLPAFRRYFGNGHEQTLDAMYRLARALAGQKRFGEVDLLLQEYLQICLSEWGEDHAKTFVSRGHLIDFYIAHERFEEALPLAETNERTLNDDTRANHTIALKQLVVLHEAWHEADPEGGHEATAAGYQSQLDAIEAAKAAEAEEPAPAVP